VRGVNATSHQFPTTGPVYRTADQLSWVRQSGELNKRKQARHTSPSPPSDDTEIRLSLNGFLRPGGMMVLAGGMMVNAVVTAFKSTKTLSTNSRDTSRSTQHPQLRAHHYPRLHNQDDLLQAQA
jgi:hypothetical protein